MTLAGASVLEHGLDSRLDLPHRPYAVAAWETVWIQSVHRKAKSKYRRPLSRKPEKALATRKIHKDTC
jgi:hypothetical protein